MTRTILNAIIAVAAIGLFSLSYMTLTGCDSEPKSATMEKLQFATSADYPPFEYIHEGDLVGFDIELAKLIAAELNKQAEFKDMQFSAILVAVQSGLVDAAIGTITATKKREENFDFSDTYYKEKLSIVSTVKRPINKAKQLAGKRIACQLGTTMEIWLKNYGEGIVILTTDTNTQAIEMLKAGHVDGVLVDAIQGREFSNKNRQLQAKVLSQANIGYAIAVKKGSPLKQQINQALENLRQQGTIQKLQEKYLNDHS